MCFKCYFCNSISSLWITTYIIPNNMSLVFLYLSLYICFLLFGHFFFFFFWTHWDRKHYYIKVVESIQFVCAGNSGISRVLCNANNYQFIHEGLFFNSSPALDLKYPLRLPYIHFYFSSLYFVYNIKLMASINTSTNQIDSYILVVLSWRQGLSCSYKRRTL